ncbi:type II toxin-antitoxin system RelE/ParE family toxin [uncultured Limnohabitans sp.]|uniref:type II toxin-antitoxin system RelE/ParE family toxin n=1 Tax=uncultured Limnohabitans sp. TaxID=768543 RepID=UPI00344FB3F6
MVDGFADVHRVCSHLDFWSSVKPTQATSWSVRPSITVTPKKYFLRYNLRMSSSRKIPAIFYRSALGSEPVREWLKTLDKADRQTVGEDIAYVQYKWPIGKPRVDHLRGPIWEVRSKIGNRIARVLFAVEASEMILLHAFVKKTQQTNPADIELATKRLKEWINGQSN